MENTNKMTKEQVQELRDYCDDKNISYYLAEVSDSDLMQSDTYDELKAEIDAHLDTIEKERAEQNQEWCEDNE